MRITLAVLAAFGSVTCAPAAPKPQAATYVWWEAENPKATDFPKTNSFDPANEKEAAVLSGGKWIGASDQRDHALFLEYDIEVPATANYGFYARKFWKHGPYRWRFDGGPWTEVREFALLDDAYMRKFLGANWTAAGMVQLTKGKHSVRIELLENQGAANFDAFVLTSTYFDARGKLKPDEKVGVAPAGWFAFEPSADPFKPSALDLRSLNEKFAGENGFIQAKGEEFVHGKSGKAVRFWAMNTGHDILDLDDLSLAYYARSLAKQGVNLVRLHGGPWGEDFRKVPPKNGQKIARFVEALKKEGIYTALSIYFPLWLNFDEKSGFPGYEGGKHPFSLLYFNPEFQRIYRSW
ncbi:hypothetical protein EON81_02820 [bacterium]|nr:MAG: hypothetical protein EON81_02820 [bacterium]